jgi:hypothetical protein
MSQRLRPWSFRGVGVSRGSTVIYRRGQAVDPFKGGVEMLDGCPQGGLLFLDLFERSAGGSQCCQIKTYIGACTCHRGPECTERDDDIGNERRVSVGSKPPQVLDGADRPLAQQG